MSLYYIPDSEELLECPYDKVHMIRAKRYQYHLIKCRQNHPCKEYAICPFNAKHEIPKPELRHHMSVCPFRATIEREVEYDINRKNGNNKILKGCTDVPVYNRFDVSTDENWDAEIPFQSRIGVDPSFFENIKYRDTTGWQKSERRDYNKKLKDQELGIEAPEMDEKQDQLRIPHQKSKAAALIKDKVPKSHKFDVFAYSLSMAGIGRGRGLFDQKSNINKPGHSTDEPLVGRNENI